MPESPFDKRGGASSMVPGYAELCVSSNFTFLTGASHPEELVERAAALGHSAIAITDTNSLAGVVRAHTAAKEVGIPLAVGCRVVTQDGFALLMYPTDRGAYARLCRLLTLGKRRAPKGECALLLHDVIDHSDGLLAVVEPPAGDRATDESFIEAVRGLRRVFDDDRLSLAVSISHAGGDAVRVEQLAAIGRMTGVPIVATNRVLYHDPARRRLQDIVTCIRHGCTIEAAGLRLEANSERHLKCPEEMAALFAAHPGAVARSAQVAACASAFSLDELRYEYPAVSCPGGLTPAQYLEREVWRGAARRYPGGVPSRTRESLRYELAFIEEMRYEAYFLTCYDIVRFARSRGILCQGRGGAANSAVCYCLGITEVDPAKFQLLFERFISRERNEPPDIDIDFEHERREEVLQYIYDTYGREHAAMTAEVICYRGRSAVREVAKAMGLPEDCVDALAKNLDRWGESPSAERVRELGLNPDEPTVARVLELSAELSGFPRHLSQHVGGMVITNGPLCDLVPIENAAMDGRTVIEWDKDDIDAMGMLKVDCLGLGMLTCLRKGFELVERHLGTEAQGHGGETDGRSNHLGADQDVSGFGGLAEGDGSRGVGVSGDIPDATGGGVRAHDADEKGSGVGAVEHRGGVRSAKHDGIRSVPEDRPRLARGAIDADRTREQPAHAETNAQVHRSAQRNRSRPPGPHPKPDLEEAPGASIPLRACVPACLCAFPHHPLTIEAVMQTERADDPVYRMISKADTVGVFQIESRAQMSMLPRLKPREFYDLVIEVAIVRPGPIQGGMVHPYLRRREGKEPVVFPSDDVKEVLGRTLGVPLFQEQAMRLAIVAAGFTPDQADGLRRSMAAWKRKGNAIHRYGMQLIDGMIANGYERDFAERCFEQVKGFSEYGFPESHAASFAILVYVSAWMKCHYPAAFAAALINSQPMGFYKPAQIVRDAQEHGVEVRPVDVNRSGWDCGLEKETERQKDGATAARSGPALRLGMRLVKGLSEVDGRKIEEAVEEFGAFGSVQRLWRASGVSVRALRCLANADAFGSMGLDRQRALWEIRPLRDERLPLFENSERETSDDSADDAGEDAGLDRLPRVSPAARVLHDYGSVGLSLKAHPVSFARDALDGLGVTACGELRSERRFPDKTPVAVAGLVLCRQRPSTASGVTFITLEDETGIANLVVWRDTFERYRRVARLSTALLVRGTVERAGEVVHVHAGSMESADRLVPGLGPMSRDFR